MVQFKPRAPPATPQCPRSIVAPMVQFKPRVPPATPQCPRSIVAPMRNTMIPQESLEGGSPSGPVGCARGLHQRRACRAQASQARLWVWMAYRESRALSCAAKKHIAQSIQVLNSLRCSVLCAASWRRPRLKPPRKSLPHSMLDRCNAAAHESEMGCSRCMALGSTPGVPAHGESLPHGSSARTPHAGQPCSLVGLCRRRPPRESLPHSMLDRCSATAHERDGLLTLHGTRQHVSQGACPR